MCGILAVVEGATPTTLSVLKRRAEKTVLYQPKSIACSTGAASEWHENFKTQLDPSGESIQRAFQSF